MQIRVPLPPGVAPDPSTVVDIPDVSATDAPIAIRCTSHRRYRGTGTIELRWYRGCLWEPCGQSSLEGYIDLIGKHLTNGDLGLARSASHTLMQNHIAIDGTIVERSFEPFWCIRMREQWERTACAPPLPLYTIEIAWANSSGGALNHKQSFRADRLDAAQRFAKHSWPTHDFDVPDTCEVLRPECLRLDPEGDRWKAKLDEMESDINALLDNLATQQFRSAHQWMSFHAVIARFHAMCARGTNDRHDPEDTA